jgi:predicted  nucleic acid-binding Zn-ribbon protein
MARSLRQTATKCGNCGLVFDDTLSNKQPGRALCKECYIVEVQRTSKEQRERRAVIAASSNRIELYRDYKMENREGFWKDINKQIRPLKDRTQIRAFISKQMDRILEDSKLMEYIKLTTITEESKNKQK